MQLPRFVSFTTSESSVLDHAHTYLPLRGQACLRLESHLTRKPLDALDIYSMHTSQRHYALRARPIDNIVDGFAAQRHVTAARRKMFDVIYREETRHIAEAKDCRKADTVPGRWVVANMKHHESNSRYMVMELVIAGTALPSTTAELASCVQVKQRQQTGLPRPGRIPISYSRIDVVLRMRRLVAWWQA